MVAFGIINRDLTRAQGSQLHVPELHCQVSRRCLNSQSLSNSSCEPQCLVSLLLGSCTNDRVTGAQHTLVALAAAAAQ